LTDSNRAVQRWLGLGAIGHSPSASPMGWIVPSPLQPLTPGSPLSLESPASLSLMEDA